MIKKELGGELGEFPNDKWKKFFDQAQEIETLDVANWKPAHLLFYFCKMYKDCFATNYTFKFNSPAPSKSFEVFQIKKLGMQLSVNPKILRDYIDWVFAGHDGRKRRFTSISFITKDEFVNEYKWNVLQANKQSLHIDRSTALSPSYQEVLAGFGFQIKTYGDLTFMFQSSKESESEMALKFNAALDHMKSEGFDASILERIV